MRKIRVAVLGSGNIGSDLTERLLLNSEFEVVALVGRNPNSAGLDRFRGRVPHITSEGLIGLSEHISTIDGIFDATSASSALENWTYAQENNKWLIDLTPSKLGTPFVPIISGISEGINLSREYSHNYSMVTCGGQSAAPILYSICSKMNEISHVEVSSSIAAKSAGVATRNNIDQYLETTEQLISTVSGCLSSKAILILNPSTPEVPMRTTVTVEGNGMNFNSISTQVRAMVSDITKYFPGYELVGDFIDRGARIYSATVRVSGAGFYLPSYAGNLDIINAAAVITAKMHMEKHSEEIFE